MTQDTPSPRARARKKKPAPEAEAKVRTETKSKTQPKAKVKPQPKTQPKIKAQTQAKTKTKTKAPRPVYFHAYIHLRSQVELLEGGRVQVELGGQPQVLPIAANQVEKVFQKSSHPEQIYLLSLWFRTADEHVTNVEVAGFIETKVTEGEEVKKPTFHIAGRLEAANQEEGVVKIKIETNPNGKLKEAFVVDVWVALELMKKLPPIGETLVAVGEYRPSSGRLIAKAIFAKKLGKQPKQKEQPEQKEKPKAAKPKRSRVNQPKSS